MPNQFQICYFPYLFLNNEKMVDYGNIFIWNFGLLCSDKIKDDNLRKHITKLIASNVMNRKPISGIGIISFKNGNDFEPLNKKEVRELDELRRVLFLSSVAKSNIHDGPNMGHFMVTADNFNIIYQYFLLGSEHTAYQAGKIVSVKSGGHRIGEVIYEKPRYVLTTNFSIDKKLFSTLKQLKKKNNRIFRRIVRATEAMMNGYSNSDDISCESSILEQARAFEILLELPERNQREDFKLKIEKYCSLNFERKRRYKSLRTKGKCVHEVGTRQKMWADRFYCFRNHIIHGERIRESDFYFYGQRHQDLALWFYLVCLKRILNEAFGNEIFSDIIRCESGKFEYDKQPLKPIIAEFTRRSVYFKQAFSLYLNL